MPRRRRSDSESASPPAQRRRTQNDVSDNEDEEAAEAAAGANIVDMSRKLVRLALAHEYGRRTIRRADITEKVLGTTGSRKFKEVWNAAQGSLRDVFGVEMVELPVKEKVTLQQRRDAQKKGTTNSATTSGWILQSILPTKYKHPAILAPPSAPTPSEESKYTAVYTLLIALIGLSGGSLPDAKMERYISKLGIQDNSPVNAGEKTEVLFKRLQKDGYIVRSKESTGTGEDDVQWLVGPRGKVEVGEDGVRGLTRAVWGDIGEREDEELEKRIERSLGVGERMAGAVRNGLGSSEGGGEKQKNRGGRRKRRGGDDEEEGEIEMEDGEEE